MLLVGILRDYYVAWPERILRPVQFVRGIVTASPWVVNTIGIGRDLGAAAARVQGTGSGARARSQGQVRAGCRDRDTATSWVRLRSGLGFQLQGHGQSGPMRPCTGKTSVRLGGHGLG